MEQEKNKAIFESMPVPEAVRIMALPTIISQLIVLVYNMADTFYLGRTNNPFMVAGVSLILPVFSNVMANLLRSVGESGKAGFGIAMGGILTVTLSAFVYFRFRRKLVNGGELR